MSQVDSVSTLAGFRKRIVLINVMFMFDRMTWIEGIGMTSHPFALFFMHTDPVYVLSCVYKDSVQVYNNGQVTCPPLSIVTHAAPIASSAKASTLHLYPNPSSGMVYLELGQVGLATVRLYTATGQLLDTRKNINSLVYELDLSGRAAGVYLVEVALEGGEVHRQFVVRE